MKFVRSLRLASAAVLLAGLGTLVSAGGAGAVDRPSWCHTGFYRSACARIINDTQGFAPGQDVPHVNNGFNLDWAGFHEGSCSSCANYVKTDVIRPGSIGGANIANRGGVVSGATGTVSFRGQPSIFGEQGGLLTWFLEVPHSGSNSADCRDYDAEYLNCTTARPSEEGSSKDAWWTWTVKDRPYALYVRNYTGGRMVSVGHLSLTNAINDIAGKHTLASVAASSGSTPGESVDTGLLTMNAKKSADFNFEYRVLDGTHAGATVTVHINVSPKEEPAQTDEGQPGNHHTGSYCNVSGMSTASLNCEVKRFTPLPFGFNRFTVVLN